MKLFIIEGAKSKSGVWVPTMSLVSVIQGYQIKKHKNTPYYLQKCDFTKKN